MRNAYASATLCLVTSFLSAQPMVDIGLIADTANDALQVKLLPHGPYGGILSGLTFTVRWPAASPASLGTRINACPTGIPCSPVALEVDGNFQYQTYNAFSVSLLVDEGCPWSGDAEVLITTIPVLNSTDLSEFLIVNDAWTGANNRNYFLSLGGTEFTGNIYAGSVTNPGDGVLQATRYLDEDLDCAWQFPDGMLAFRTMVLDPGSLNVITNNTGRLTLALPPGDYSLTRGTDPYIHPSCPATAAVPFTLIADSLLVLDIADTSSSGLDLDVFGVSGEARPGFTHGVYLLVRNISNEFGEAAGLSLQFDPILTIDSIFPEPASSTLSSITWDLSDVPPMGYLPPMSSRSVQVFLTVPPDTALTGDQLIYTATLTTADDDANNNASSWSNIVVNSVDPNDKQARTSSGLSDEFYLLDEDSLITYTIRFQNTGTAAAIDIVVTDTLSEDLDMASFVQGIVSHAFDVSFKPGRVVEWRFEDIFLPDSNTNEGASHGLIQFQIRPKAPLVAGTVLANTANIYFDFNPPVITEPSVLTAEFSTSLADLRTSPLEVSPNPARDEVIVGSMALMRELSVYGPDGRLLRTIRPLSRQVRLDLTGIAPGVLVVSAQLEDGRVLQRRVVKY